MSELSAKILVFSSGDLACIRVVGRANFTSSMDFKVLFAELAEKGVNRFLVDLSECLLMDSTFLGVLTGLGLERSNRGGCAITLLNPNARVLGLLENLGVIHLFRVENGNVETLCGGSPKESVAPAQVTRDEITMNCLKAHQTLMEINTANVAKFKDVALFLSEDLKKSKVVQ